MVLKSYSVWLNMTVCCAQTPKETQTKTVEINHFFTLSKVEQDKKEWSRSGSGFQQGKVHKPTTRI